jgi:hypothetical protein
MLAHLPVYAKLNTIQLPTHPLPPECSWGNLSFVHPSQLSCYFFSFSYARVLCLFVMSKSVSLSPLIHCLLSMTKLWNVFTYESPPHLPHAVKTYTHIFVGTVACKTDPINHSDTSSCRFWCFRPRHTTLNTPTQPNEKKWTRTRGDSLSITTGLVNVGFSRPHPCDTLFQTFAVQVIIHERTNGLKVPKLNWIMTC